MNIPPKYEDLVLKVAEMERREAALREELDKAVWELVDARDVSLKFEESLKAICQPIIEDSRRTLIIKDGLDILAGHIGENGDEGYSTVMGAIHELSRLTKFNSELQQSLTAAEQLIKSAWGLMPESQESIDWHFSAGEYVKSTLIRPGIDCTHPPGCKQCSWCGFKDEPKSGEEGEGS